MDNTEAKEGTAMNSTKRTTIVRHPDGTISKRTSKTRVYEYAVVSESTPEQRAAHETFNLEFYEGIVRKAETCENGVAVAFVDSVHYRDQRLYVHVYLYPAGYTGPRVVHTPGGQGGSYNSEAYGGAAIWRAHVAQHGEGFWVGNYAIDADGDEAITTEIDGRRSDLDGYLAQRRSDAAANIAQKVAAAEAHLASGKTTYGVAKWSSRRDLAESYVASDAYCTQYVVECEAL